MIRSLLTTFLTSLLVLACGGPQEPPPPDVRVLLRTNRYDDAVAEAERLVAEDRSVQTLAVLATARAAQTTLTGGSVEGAVEALTQAVAISTRGEVVDAFSEEVTGSMAFTGGNFSAAASALATLAQGWDSGGDASDIIRGTAAMLNLGAYGSEQQAPAESLHPLIASAIGLLEGTTNDFVFESSDMHSAWVSFRSAGTIAASTSGPVGASAAELAVRIAEANPQLAVAIACDLSSPRERLRDALMRSGDANSLGRLSAVMASAEGCSPGTYAP